MTDEPTGAVDNCPACGADMRGAASPACPLCGWAPAAAEDHPPEVVFHDEARTNPYAAPRAEVGDRQEARGPAELVWVIARSIGLTVLTLLSAAIAFTVTCFPIGLVALGAGNGAGDAAIVIAVSAGLVSALVVVVLMARKFWPRKDRRG